MGSDGGTGPVPDDFADRTKSLRGQLGLTQTQLAARLGVSFATVNRWENAQARPSALTWNQLQKLYEAEILDPQPQPEHFRVDPDATATPPALDFTADPEIVRVVVEGHRLSYGHLYNPAFATEISQIDPLPHQRIAVYDHMLPQPRLRFALFDDPGAGKTIMTGLYDREMLARRLVHRILIVPPAGLVGNWEREMNVLFSLPFRVVEGNEAKSGNPFIGPESNLVIVSLDTLRGNRMFSRLQEPDVIPYDLVVFDECHKLAADREPDLRVRKTDRYKLAEALAGIQGLGPRWQLSWSPHHLLLLTATPHMGKDYPYYCLWRLLEPNVLATKEAFDAYPPEARQQHFIRRTKEEMVTLEGKPLYPTRLSDTLSYDLTQGPNSEQHLYDETTAYLQSVYNRAKLLNRSAAQLAMSVFQRRLASSTYALMRSFERRIAKLDGLIADVEDGKLTMDQLMRLQQQIAEEGDVLDSMTADEESTDDDQEENEVSEDRLLRGVIAVSLDDLRAERGQVERLLQLARRVHDDQHMESKFQRLRDIITDSKYLQEKLLIFSEHRDTLDYLVRRLEGMGYTGQVAAIHGGLHYTARQEQVELFRKPLAEGGARFLVATDAAGEGINLQFCWVMINFDVPWNPARLEQRMGRIHRYGQKHDPVIILNVVAAKTREGRVLKTLLDKLEKIRKQLKSDKVFDVIGRIFEGVSIRQYMEEALTEEGAAAVEKRLEGQLTKEQVQALAERDKRLFGDGGDVCKELPRLRADIEQEGYTQLLPGYVRRFIDEAAALLDIGLEGDLDGQFAMKPLKRGALDRLLPVLDAYPAVLHKRLTVYRPKPGDGAVWLHPGEAVFEGLRGLVEARLGQAALRGGIFVDPTVDVPYLFHVALVSVVRRPDPETARLAHEEVIEYRLVGLKQFDGDRIVPCPVEQLLLLRGGQGLPAAAQRLAVAARDYTGLAQAFLLDRIGRGMAAEHRQKMLDSLPQREEFLTRGFDYQEAELAAARQKQAERAREGKPGAQKELDHIKIQQRQLVQRRRDELLVIRREPELVAPGGVTFIAHALVVPSSDPEDQKRHDAEVERIAMHYAWAHEEAAGATVKDVHTPELARAAGLPDNPGFDLLSIRPGGEKRAIEVKGRAGVGEVEVSANEWAKACNIREGYWLFVAYDCATPNPRLLRVQDPFGNLLAKAKGSMVISVSEIIAASSDREKQ
jgi:superfamily II DNA or RNA helicase/DNA-binding XRE family transcriptional regulator